VWGQGVFELSRTTIESLSSALQDNDFAVFVFSPDDLTKIRNTTSASVRDNVLFEFGLFIGRLGRERVYFLLPTAGDLHLPTDLLGITPGRYESTRSDWNMQAATGAVCHQIVTQVRKLGLAPGRSSARASGEEAATEAIVKRSWIADYFDKKFEAAKETLSEEVATLKGEDALATGAWILLCDYHIAGGKDISPLIRFGTENAESARTQVVVTSILRLEGHASKAMDLLTAARTRFPRDASIAQAIARVHGDVEDNQSAIAELEHFGPDQFPDVAIDLAEALERESKPTEALQVVQRCYANHPSHKGLRFKYARIAQDLDKHEMALALLFGLRVDDPDSIEYWGYFGNSCLRLDLHDTALSAYRRAEKLMKEGQSSQWIVSNIGNLFSNKGLPTEACSYLERALKHEPMSEYAHDRMAGALKKKAAEEKLLDKVRAEGKRQIREVELKLLYPPAPPAQLPNALATLAMAQGGLSSQSR
jgi:tetratricopeptide (TPR) repeat protein